MEFKDYYKILGVKPNAGLKEIKIAYRKLARKYHPDVNKDVEAEQRMRELNAAYEVLSNPIFREDYDQRRSYGGFVASEEDQYGVGHHFLPGHLPGLFAIGQDGKQVVPWVSQPFFHQGIDVVNQLLYATD